MAETNYSVKDVAEELHTNVTAVYGYINREKDPLPSYVLKGKENGQMILKEDFNAWLLRNIVPVKAKRFYKKGGK